MNEQPPTHQELKAALLDILQELIAQSKREDCSPARAFALGLTAGSVRMLITNVSHIVHAPEPMPDIPELYDVARDACHSVGAAWTDPRTGIRYPPPPKTKH